MTGLLRSLAAGAVVLLLTVPPAYADDATTPTAAAPSAATVDATPTAQPEESPTASTSEPAVTDPAPAVSEETRETQSETTAEPKIEQSTAAVSASTRTAQRATTACVDHPVVTLGAGAAVLGETLRVTGTGWCTSDATAGSTIAFKLDSGGVSHVDTSVHTNKTIWAIVHAEADGSFDAEIPMPDGTAATSTPAVGADGPHSFTLLTGSLGPDPVRSITTSEFDLVAPGGDAAKSLWGFPLAVGSAKAWVERAVTTTEGVLRVAGTGWLTSSGAPSTIAVKLNASDSTQFQRTTDIEQGDATIWALFTADADGSFDRELDLPAGLTGGQYLTVRLASGKFGVGDTQRSLLSPLLSVDGTTYAAPEKGADVVCRPTTATTTVKVTTPTVPLGGAVTVTGSGWCNPAGGGSRIGVKIDDGAISHLDSSVHSNRTIWAIIQADHATGTFTATIALPDGTTRTSTPVLTNGAHTLRFLSGSLRAGDTIRSLDADLVVGTYRPNGSPDPLAGSALRASTRHGLTATRTAAGKLRLTLPQSPVGTWVFLSAYVADGSPRYPWTDRWFRLDARHGITVRIPESMPTGRIRLVAQSGEQGSVGQVIGWTRATLRSVVARTVAAVAPVVSLPAAAPAVPVQPVSTYAGLTRVSQHAVTAVLAGTVATLTFPETEPGDRVFLTVYAAKRVLPGGWVTLDAQRQVRADLGALGDGDFRVVGQTDAGALAGWAQVTLGEPVDDVESPATTATSREEPTVAPAATDVRAGEDAPFISAMDGWLLAAGAVVLAGTGLTLRTISTRKAGA
ncbi:hypothetical protein [Nocardioides sp. Kera G14]|uniref:hypothetical protein n=1 Tax=Nocardioides sp. Kera G14 TaxID=2884264 RepID=UPI001D119D37|nr:hypothetical protein [Nocardioides sp. Kera G14]UDY24272.1 hypothetical protein LH076_02950 [Nocardioides sp. Kera G14]